jgi:hypothetical protein
MGEFSTICGKGARERSSLNAQRVNFQQRLVGRTALDGTLGTFNSQRSTYQLSVALGRSNSRRQGERFDRVKAGIRNRVRENVQASATA